MARTPTRTHYQINYTTVSQCPHNFSFHCRLLLRFGANINLQTAQGDTACHLASYRGYGQCVQCLAEHGADINITNSKQHTVVEDALNRGHYEIYQYLLAVQEISKYVFHYSILPFSPLYRVVVVCVFFFLFKAAYSVTMSIFRKKIFSF